MDKVKRLEELLNNVSDGYPDFVISTVHSAIRNNITDQLIAFIEEHPDANSSEIIFKNSELKGIKKVCPPKADQAAK